MTVKPAEPIAPEAPVRQFYVRAMQILDREKVPYLVGGGYAMAYYSGIARNTKDFDLFVRADDHRRVLDVMAGEGFRTEYFYPFWIAKVLSGDSFIDIIYNSGNGLCPVDDRWFERAVPATVLGHRTRLVPAEEQLWSKGFVMDRDRFDGTDVHHLILGQGEALDWERLLRRFGGHERVLLAHVILFGYAYPCERDRVPGWVVGRLEQAVRDEPAPDLRICRGTFIAQRGYGTAIREWGYSDGRLKPHGPLSPAELAQLPPP